MPVLTPWRRLRSNPNATGRPAEAPAGSGMCRTLPGLRRTFAVVLGVGLCCLAGMAAALALRAQNRVDLKVLWEFSPAHPLLITERFVLATLTPENTDDAPALSIEVATGATTRIRVPTDRSLFPLTEGAAWVDNSTLVVTGLAGERTPLEVPYDSLVLGCSGKGDGIRVFLAYPAANGTWSGYSTLGCFTPAGPAWETTLSGTPLMARQNGHNLIVGVTDLATGPVSSVYLIDYVQGVVLWTRQLGPGFLRNLKFLPDRSVLAAWTSGVLLLSPEGEILSQYTPDGRLLSADADERFVCAVETRRNGRTFVRGLTRQGAVLWQASLAAPAVVRCFDGSVVCLAGQKVQCFSSDSGRQLWYYEVGNGTAWLLGSGILHYDGQTTRLLEYHAGPG